MQPATSPSTSPGSKRSGGKLGTIRTSPFSPIKFSIGATLDGGRRLRPDAATSPVNSAGSRLPVWPPVGPPADNNEYNDSTANVRSTAAAAAVVVARSPNVWEQVTAGRSGDSLGSGSNSDATAVVDSGVAFVSSLASQRHSKTISRADRQYERFHHEHQLRSMQAVQRFIEMVLEEPLPSDDIHECLHDGIILCRLINKLRPGMIRQIGRRPLPFVKMENICNFLNAAEALGLRSSDLFRTVDLYEGKDMMQVTITLLTLSRVVAQIPPSQLGLPDSHRRTKSEQPTEIIDTARIADESTIQSLSALAISTSTSFPDTIGDLTPTITDVQPVLERNRESLVDVAAEVHGDTPKSGEGVTGGGAASSQEASTIGRNAVGDRELTATLPLRAGVRHIDDSVRIQRRATLRQRMEEERVRAEALAVAAATLNARMEGYGDGDDEDDGDQGNDELDTTGEGKASERSATALGVISSRRFRAGSAPESNSFLDDQLLARLATHDAAPRRRRTPQRKCRPAHPPPVIPTVVVADSTAGDISAQAPSIASTTKATDTMGRRNRLRGQSTTGSQGDNMGQLFQSMHRRVHRDSTASSLVTSESRDRLALYSDELEIIAHYQLGNCIGKGQFGSVYRALNLETGEMVAIKRVYILDKDEKEVESLMQEVTLLEKLAHTNVVKYEGFIKGDGFLNIVLEYIENGSLLTTLKSFGVFPEKLVASYTIKILEGLVYLHDQDVAHCDLKAANLLTTKDGNVKLSDFGVSLNLQLVESEIGEMIAGTPNWMAPEVIELKGASTASDIWSLGCTIVELLTGKPPYWGLLPMTTLFRIVEDDCPPLPDCASPALLDFLRCCFCKEPEERPTAKELLTFPWLREHIESKGKDVSFDTLPADSTNGTNSASITTVVPPSCDVSDGSLGTSSSQRRQNCQHVFVKGTFGRAMTCRICMTPLNRKKGFICDECGLVCHRQCAEQWRAIQSTVRPFTDFSQSAPDVARTSSEPTGCIPSRHKRLPFNRHKSQAKDDCIIS